MSRNATEGVVALSGNKNKNSIIEINCETDFVAKNEDFINFAKELSNLNNNCESNIEKLKKIKMSNDKTVDENLVSMISKIGEKITIGRSKTLCQPGEKKFSYLHTVVKDNLSKLAVITSIETTEKSDKVNAFGKQISMHVAASNPIALSSELIDKKILQKEEELISEELKNSGKPDDIAKKISAGKLNKYKEENSLLTQAWVMEPKKKVKEIIKEINISDLKIKEFYRIKIGE